MKMERGLTSGLSAEMAYKILALKDAYKKQRLRRKEPLVLLVQSLVRQSKALVLKRVAAQSLRKKIMKILLKK